MILSFTLFVSAGEDWRPVTPAELALKEPVVEKDADAEAIFWEVRVDDSAPEELALKHYVRVKIFTERGRELYSKKDIVFSNGMRIRDLEARVTKKEGSSIVLKKDDILEREIVKANGFKARAKSFALPGLEIGSIVEYRYREIIDNGSADMRLIFQREIPIQSISFFVRPFSGQRGMAYQPFNVGNTKFEKDKDNFFRATMKNVPAFNEEPLMLPADEVRSWIYIYYTDTSVGKAEEYWKDISKRVFDVSKGTLKVNDDVKRVTSEVIGGATTDEEKVKKIFDFCKTQIKNISYSPKVTDEERKKVRESKTPADTLKLKMGSVSDIDSLFGGMARAAGFDARIALSGDRNELFFTPNIPNSRLMLNSSSIAVKIGENWRFFSPAAFYSTYGMLNWNEEGQTALISDPKELKWEQIPLSSAEKSLEKRTGKFKLLEDGTLEGEAKLEYTGQQAVYWKNYNNGDSDPVQETTLKNWIKRHILGTAEVENFTIENVSDPEKPFVYKFKIRVPGYASRTGKRIFFQPNVFERSMAPVFSANTRKYDIYIDYPYAEQDDISIDLPSGFDLENAESPAPIKDQQGISSHETNIVITKDRKTLIYKRDFSFGNKGFIRFPANSYAPLKALFEAFNKADTHQLTLRQSATQAPAAKAN